MRAWREENLGILLNYNWYSTLTIKAIKDQFYLKFIYISNRKWLNWLNRIKVFLSCTSLSTTESDFWPSINNRTEFKKTIFITQCTHNTTNGIAPKEQESLTHLMAMLWNGIAPNHLPYDVQNFVWLHFQFRLRFGLYIRMNPFYTRFAEIKTCSTDNKINRE